MTERALFVPGAPAPQGSKRHVGNGVMVESSKRLRPWRGTVTGAIVDAGWQHDPILAGPVRVTLTFAMPRPKHHYGTGRNAGVLRAAAPVWHEGRGDADKLARAVLDALTDSGAIRDDGQVAWLTVSKVYAQQPGVSILLGRIGADT